MYFQENIIAKRIGNVNTIPRYMIYLCFFMLPYFDQIYLISSAAAFITAEFTSMVMSVPIVPSAISVTVMSGAIITVPIATTAMSFLGASAATVAAFVTTAAIFVT